MATGSSGRLLTAGGNDTDPETCRGGFCEPGWSVLEIDVETMTVTRHARDLALAEYNARTRLWVLDALLAELGDGQAAARLGPARLDSLRHPARLDSLQGTSGRSRRQSNDFENRPLGVFRNRGNFDLSKAAYDEMISKRC